MSPHSQWSTILEPQQRREDLDVEVAQSSGEEVNVVPRNEVAVVVSKEQVKAHKVVKARVNSSINAVALEVEEADVLDGVTMTSHKETEILQSLFDLAGL